MRDPKNAKKSSQKKQGDAEEHASKEVSGLGEEVGMLLWHPFVVVLTVWRRGNLPEWKVKASTRAASRVIFL